MVLHDSRAIRFYVLHSFMCPSFGIEEFVMAKTKELQKQASTKVNLTIKIDKALLRKMRIIAAEKGTSISALVVDAINEQSTRSGSYEESMKRAIALMNEGLGGSVWERGYSRDELHERR
jgi:predicted transcriptional regulator